jgi:protein tyrosine phosphatase
MGNQESSGSKKTDPLKQKQQKAAAKFAKKLTVMKMSDIIDEFSKIKSYNPPQTVRYHPHQAFKNRYRDIECHEPTRVILKGRPEEENYIHANWATAGKQRYICCQGPLGHTIDDFWYMVATEKVGAIIMLCDLVEEGQRKCAEYWPRNDGDRARYGEVDVENISVGQSTLPKVHVTILRITYNKKSHLLNHYNFLGFPDNGIPDDQIIPIKLLDLAKDCVKPVYGSAASEQEISPIIVHCSAGIGRTGVLIAIDMARARLQEGTTILSVPKLVEELRNLRTHAIQGPSQYLYLYGCILQLCVECGYLEDSISIRKWQEKCHAFLVEYKEAVLNR